MNLTAGQNTPLNCHHVSIGFAYAQTPVKLATDVSIFLLNADNKVSHDADFVFFNNPNRADIGVVHQPHSGETVLELDKIPASISKIVFAITITDGVNKQQSFTQLGAVTVRIKDYLSAQELVVFALDTRERSETALIIGECYSRNGQWKFRAIGQGFNGGLQPLAQLYGVEVGEGESSQKVEQPAPEPIKKTPISLKKSGEKATISLAKGAKVTARLKWATKADLDLYCFYVDEAGQENKVYYRQMGDLNAPPFIKLLGDSQIAGEEVVEISRPDKVRYALIAAYSALSNGVGSFYSYQAQCVITDNQGQTVSTHLEHSDPYSYWVALARIDFSTAGKLTIENVESYSNKVLFEQQFEQRTGEKPGGWFSKVKVNGVDSYDPERSPHLFRDGSFMMSVGVREFK